MDTETPKICNDYKIFVRNKQERISSQPFGINENSEKMFLISLSRHQWPIQLWTLNGEDLRVAIVFNVQKHGGELWTAAKYITEKVFQFFMLHVRSVFTLCHARVKNFPRLSIHVYRFVFRLQGCTRFGYQHVSWRSFFAMKWQAFLLTLGGIRVDSRVPLPLHVLPP